MAETRRQPHPPLNRATGPESPHLKDSKKDPLMVNHTGRARRGIAVIDPEIPAGNEVIPQESQKAARLDREPETARTRWFHQPGEARFIGRPGSGWRCFELHVYIWISSMGNAEPSRRRAMRFRSAAGPAPHARRMMDWDSFASRHAGAGACGLRVASPKWRGYRAGRSPGAARSAETWILAAW